jgi:3,5-epimerase/4-reductase
MLRVLSPEDPTDPRSELTTHKPTRVINTAGVRGTPNADWCEDHKIETFRSNVLGALNVVDSCYQLGIHVTQFGSACIYNLPEDQVRSRSPFSETEEPFFKGAWYHRSRLLSEQTIGHYPNLLLLRMRIPLAADLHQNNHVARLLKYDKILDLTGVSILFHTLRQNLMANVISISLAPVSPTCFRVL